MKALVGDSASTCNPSLEWLERARSMWPFDADFVLEAADWERHRARFAAWYEVSSEELQEDLPTAVASTGIPFVFAVIFFSKWLFRYGVWCMLCGFVLVLLCFIVGGALLDCAGITRSRATRSSSSLR